MKIFQLLDLIIKLFRLNKDKKAKVIIFGLLSYHAQVQGQIASSFWLGTSEEIEIPCDDNYDKVSLLLHMDGANNSTVFTDNSVNSNLVVPSGNAKLSNAQSKFGGTSAVFDGSGDWLTIPSNTAFNYGTGDFTIEGWFRHFNSATNRTIFNQLVTQPLYNGLSLSILNDQTLYLELSSGGTNYTLSTSTVVSANTWHHFAIVKNGTTYTVYLNGSQVSTSTITALIGYDGRDINIGKYANDLNTRNFYGFIDEVRVTKGVARYTSNFIVPNNAFENIDCPAISDITVDYLVVAGGGGTPAVTYTGTGGGGAGGLIESQALLNPNKNYEIKVGNGNTGKGENSYIFDITANENIVLTEGGGSGGAYSNGASGGSGGGAGGDNSTGQYYGGAGIPGQGNNGGSQTATNTNGGGGGGGAGGVGGNNTAGNISGNGGIGAIVSIITSEEATAYSVGEVSGSNVYFAGGGAGGVRYSNSSNRFGGLGGGGDASNIRNSKGQPGAPNTGGGAGANQSDGATLISATSGGSGVVILKFSSSYNINTSGNLVYENFISGTNRIIIFKSGTGTMQFVASSNRIPSKILNEYPGAKAAYSLRLLNNLYTGPLVAIRREFDNIETDVYSLANGNIDESWINSFCSGTNCFVKTWYDQSGNNNNANQLTELSQPQIYDSLTGVILENGKLAIQLDGDDDALYFLTPTGLLGNDEKTIAAVFRGLVDTLDTQMDIGTRTNFGGVDNSVKGYGFALGATNSIGRYLYYHTGIGTIEGGYLPPQKQYLGIAFVDANGTNPELYANGVLKFSSNDLSQLVSPYLELPNGYTAIGNAGSSFSNSKFQEVIFYPENKNIDRLGIETNINNYYNIY